MASVKQNTTIKEYQNFVKEVYGPSNDRYFSLGDMLINVQRFIMRGLKGIRKGDKEKIKINLLIAQSWFFSMMNSLHIDLEKEIWKRFPYLCSHCASCPCLCQENKVIKQKKIFGDGKKRPKTFEEFQNMFNKIYLPEKQSIEHRGVHLGEELGEFSEAILIYRGGRKNKDFKRIEIEAADLFSCLMGAFNSLKTNVAKELSIMFSKNCHACKNAPCTCSFASVINFKS